MSEQRQFIPLQIAIMTVSDTRTEETDKSGGILRKLLEEAGHQLSEKLIVPDNIYRIRAEVSCWFISENVDVVITTGGTGLTGRDGTPEAVRPLLDKVIDGFGEMFRVLSYEDIGTSTLQSRALAGVANGTFIFCLPGSSGACK
ncbi:MAG: molybdenum cofactor biosynthesis protein, partial [Halobacteria archaeon]|nr:molybdenum cofactor biosynthesis protein [Halobacteria archaeon]